MRTPVLLVCLLGLLAACASPGTGQGARGGDTRLRVAAAAEQAGDTGRAAMIMADELARRPGDVELRLRYAASLTAMGNHVAAAQVLAEGMAQAGQSRRLALPLAQARLRAGDIEPAAQDFERLVAEMPDDAAVLTGLGVVRDMQGRHSEAQALYTRVLARNPGHVAARNNLGLSLALSGRATEAVAMLDQLARTQAGASPRVRHNLALAHGAAGDEGAARGILAYDMGPEEAAAAARAFAGLAPGAPAQPLVRALLPGPTVAQVPAPMPVPMPAPVPAPSPASAPASAPVVPSGPVGTSLAAAAPPPGLGAEPAPPTAAHVAGASEDVVVASMRNEDGTWVPIAPRLGAP